MTAKPHWFGPKLGSGITLKAPGRGHPRLAGTCVATHFDPFPDGGGYPYKFVDWAMKEMGCTDARQILHLCSGSMRSGTRVDIRESMKPTVVADVRRLPFPDCSFDFIMADPPYSKEYASNLYGTGDAYPPPGAIVKEACRVLRPGGCLGLLHFMVPMITKPMQIIRIYGITTGSGYAIRAWTLMVKGRLNRSMKPKWKSLL